MDLNNGLNDRLEKSPDAKTYRRYMNAARDDFLKMFSEHENLSNELRLSSCRREWPKIVGGLSKHTAPYRLAREKLVVRADNSVYAHELSMYLNEIMPKIKRIIPEAAGIFIETGPIKRSAFSTGSKETTNKSSGVHDSDLLEMISGLEEDR